MLPARERLQNGLELNETSLTIFHTGNKKYDAFPSGEIFNYSFDLIFTKKKSNTENQSLSVSLLHVWTKLLVWKTR